MHQLVQSDFNGLGKALTSAKSMLTSPMRGVGKRSCVIVNFTPKNTVEKIGMEFFVETVVNQIPGDPDFGFTTEDLNLFRGVAIYVIDGDGDSKSTEGEVMTFNTFLDRYISADDVRIPIEVCMEKLKKEALVTQGFIDKLNNIWLDRDVLRKELYEKKVH